MSVYAVGGVASSLVTLTGYRPDSPFRFAGDIQSSRCRNVGLSGSVTIGKVPPSKWAENHERIGGP